MSFWVFACVDRVANFLRVKRTLIELIMRKCFNQCLLIFSHCLIIWERNISAVHYTCLTADILSTNFIIIFTVRPQIELLFLTSIKKRQVSVDFKTSELIRDRAHNFDVFVTRQKCFLAVKEEKKKWKNKRTVIEKLYKWIFSKQSKNPTTLFITIGNFKSYRNYWK